LLRKPGLGLKHAARVFAANLDVRLLKMNRSLILILLLLLTNSVFASQCAQDHSLESAFNKSERGFLIYVTETKLEEELLKSLSKKYPPMDESSEYVKLISANYRVIEEFKGEINYRPRLLDMLGIGTGYVGLTPGQYYLVLLPKISKDEDPELRNVNMCTVPIGHYRLKTEDFQKELDRVRKLRDK
jgi:hypothetical protein